MKSDNRVLTMSRRSFLKSAAVCGAVATVCSFAAAPAFAETAPVASDKQSKDVRVVRTCCRGCGKMECSVFVTVENGRVVKLEGDDSAMHSMGNCCTKSHASIQACYHPDRIMYPMKRTNPKGSDDPGWKRISWQEAWDTTAAAMTELIEKYTNKTVFSVEGTSRLYGSSCSRSYRACFEGINSAAAPQVCKGPRRLVAACTLDNGMHWAEVIAFPKVYVQWGTDQTQSNYDDACRVADEAAQHSKVFISIDSRICNCAHWSDYHLTPRPGTDGALACAWAKLIIDRELYDDYVIKYWTNCPFLVCDEIDRTGWTGVKGNLSEAFDVRTKLLKESDLIEGGSCYKFMVWDNNTDSLTYFDANENDPVHGGMWERQTEYDIPTTGFESDCNGGGWVPDYPDLSKYCDPALWCEDGFDVTLKDGRQVKCKTVWQRYYDEVLSEWTLEQAEETTTVEAKLIEESCLAYATRFDERVGNGGLNLGLALEHSSRASVSYRNAYLVMYMTGNFDIPGGNRGMTRQRCGSSIPPYTLPFYSSQSSVPGGLYTTTTGVSEWVKRTDCIGVDVFPMLRWWNTWTDASLTWQAVYTGKPYPMKAVTCGAGDFMNTTNATYAWEGFKLVDFFWDCDIWQAPGTRMADILAPCNHWLETTGWLRASQGSSGAYGTMLKVLDCPGDVLFEVDALMGLYKAYGTPFFDPATGNAWDRPYTDTLDKQVGQMGYKNYDEFVDAFEKHGWWQSKETYVNDWYTYRRYLMGYHRNGRGGAKANAYDGIPGYGTPTMKCEFWSTIIESLVPDKDAELPVWTEPEMSPVSTPELFAEYPFVMTTGRRSPIYFHNEHRQLPWCRELWPVPRVEINPVDAEKLGLQQGDWVWIESKWGKVRECVDLYHGVKPGVINAEHQWWFPELNNATKGFDLCSINCVMNRNAQDPLVGACQLRAVPVKLYKATPENSPLGNPIPCTEDGIEIIHDSSDYRLKAWANAIKKIQNDRELGINTYAPIADNNDKWEMM